ncbi:MAG: hypothetical protein NT151_02775 [Acidobacteria bacterium]|nr:hypothetical protein [Acidobacteriota bacterium]
MVEAKSGATITADAFDGLRAFDEIAKTAWPERAVERRVIYGGDQHQPRSYAAAVPWTDIHRV